MPICSYIVYPDPGQTPAVKQQLEQVTGCSVFPAEAHDLLLLVTETQGERDEKRLQEALKQQPNIQCLAMAFAHSENGATPDQTVEEAS